jgi:hypothetical protein
LHGNLTDDVYPQCPCIDIPVGEEGNKLDSSVNMNRSADKEKRLNGSRILDSDDIREGWKDDELPEESRVNRNKRSDIADKDILDVKVVSDCSLSRTISD